VIKLFTPDILDALVDEAQASSRRRQNKNIHTDYAEACQRLFNAIEPDSYIRPHRHSLEPRAETMIAVRGLIALVIFDDEGNIIESTRFGACGGEGHAVGVEVPPGVWHTVVALESGSVLFEVKAGPFNPKNLLYGHLKKERLNRGDIMDC
jgi:cupin fold WbuC family metalloprotein